MIRTAWVLLSLTVLVVGAGCSDGDAHQNEGGGHSRRGGGGPPQRASGGEGRGSTAVPVEVAAVERRRISSYIETNGILEAENEVDLVARVSAPIVELLAEEGMAVRKGQPLARLDQDELRVQMDLARVALDEATLAYERAKKLRQEDLIPEEEYERAKSAWESAMAQLEANKIQLGYSELRAPFDGWIVTRYVDFAEQVNVNTPLFRLSDFDPMLCPIQVPERELSKLHADQPAHLLLEPWPDHEFQAKVLRISPVVDAATGTIKVTLEVRAEGKLRPGMFARVYLETDTRENALVIPKAALSLESIGDTVYLAAAGVAARREVRLGFREGDFVEIAEGLAEGDSVVVVGHDGLSDGTPIEILSGDGARPRAETTAVAAALGERAGHPGGGPPPGPGDGRRGPRDGRRGPGPGGRPDFSTMSPEQLERAKEFMRQRGMTEEQITERIGASDKGSEQDGR